jgi:GT2 family glycosyltransferase
MPNISVIIPSRPHKAEIKAVQGAQSLSYPKDKIEILITRGMQPAKQRNKAMHEAAGEFIYFLDDDSMALPSNVQKGLAHFQDPKVMIVGGPNLCPPDAPDLEQAFAQVMSSWIAFGPSRSRYKATGKTRESSEKELILCNLMARRDILLQLGGFDEKLYPNEENALMDAIQKNGGKMIYDPDFYVYRRPRRDWKSFCKMLWGYGRGRAEQFRSQPTVQSALNFVPPLFCVYLVILPFLGKWWLIPLGVYLLSVIAQIAHIWAHEARPKWQTWVAIPLCHLLYGAGFLRGLVGSYRSASLPADTPIRVDKITPT